MEGNRIKATISSRDSNIELLRLICMVGIVIMHFIGLAAYPEVWNPAAPLSTNVVAGTVLCSFTILSVNIFGLISGYYGIRFSWMRLLTLYLCCAFYALIGCGIGYAFGEAIPLKSVLLEVILPFSHATGGLWYIECYVGLVLFSPLLNKAIENFTRNEYVVALVLFTIANVYLGRFWKVPTYNIYGYSVAQLIYLYLIGGYVRRFVSVSELSNRQIVLPLVLCVTLWNILTLTQHYVHVPHWSPTSYNHLVVLIASVCVLILLLKRPFRSQWVNSLATGSLAIYLVHQNEHVWSVIVTQLSNYQLFMRVAEIPVLIVLAVFLCFGIALFDKIRQFIMNALFQIIQK